MSSKPYHILGLSSWRLEESEFPLLPGANAMDENLLPDAREEADQLRIKSFTAAYHSLYAPTYYFARRFVSPEEAADLVAEAFCKLWKRPGDFSNLPRLKVFLQIMVRNASIDAIRHDQTRKNFQAEARYLQGENAGAEPMEEFLRAELLKQIHEAIEKLPSRCKEIFKLHWLEGLKNQDIADKLQVSVNTVINQKVRALSKLRIAFKDHPFVAVLMALLLDAGIF
jgi:RNA polymerase sigma-70 factor (family 1)